MWLLRAVRISKSTAIPYFQAVVGVGTRLPLTRLCGVSPRDRELGQELP